jgi:hypothetical protein
LFLLRRAARIFSAVNPIGQNVHHARGVKRIPKITANAVAISIKTRMVNPISLISPLGAAQIINPKKEPIISAHKQNLNTLLLNNAGRLSEKKANGRVTSPINEPRGHILAQLIFPHPDKAVIIGVNIHAKPKSPKGCHILAIVIHTTVIIHDQPCHEAGQRLPSTIFDFIFRVITGIKNLLILNL